MHEHTEFTLSRDTDAIQIPSGEKMMLPEGTQGVITQTLGGSYTIATPYGLSRIAEKDLDALGLEKPQTNGASEKTTETGPVDEKAVWEQLKQCYDPEIPVNIVDLGLVYEVRIGGDTVHITYTLTTMGCPIGPLIEAQMHELVAGFPGVENVEAEMVLRPPWTPEMMSEEAKAALGYF